jgi:hypothetical protein
MYAEARAERRGLLGCAMTILPLKVLLGFFFDLLSNAVLGQLALEQLRVVEPRTGGPSFGALLGGVGIGRRPFLIVFLSSSSRAGH